MKGGSEYHVIVGLILVGTLMCVPGFASAATLFLSPAESLSSVGRVFPVTVRVNTQGVAINAAEGTLSFNPRMLRVVSVSSSGTIFNLNVENPTFSNTDGTIRWTGVILNPGFTGQSGKLLTVNFEGIAPGQAVVAFTAGAVLANDGQGTNLLTGMSDGMYSIGDPTEPLASPSASVVPLLPTTGRSLTSDLLRIIAIVAIFVGIWLLFVAWRRHRRHRAQVALVKKDIQKDSDQLTRIVLDMDEEIALLSRIAKNRPLYPEEKYLRSKLLQYTRAMKSYLSDTHRRLAKKR